MNRGDSSIPNPGRSSPRSAQRNRARVGVLVTVLSPAAMECVRVEPGSGIGAEILVDGLAADAELSGQGGFSFTSPSAGSQPVNLIPPIPRRSRSQRQ